MPLKLARENANNVDHGLLIIKIKTPLNLVAQEQLKPVTVKALEYWISEYAVIISKYH